MNQQNLNDGGCRKINHAQSKFIKFCKHENCQDRILCSYCFESQIHQTHDNYNPDQIVNISDINIQLDSYLMSEKMYQEQLKQTKKQAKYLKENISDMFENFITNIRWRKQEQQRHVQKCTYTQNTIKQNNFNQEEILEILQIIGVQNNKINIEKLTEKIISIENYVHEKLEQIQSVHEIVKSQKMQKLEEEELPSIDEIKNYQYLQRELYFQFDEIYAIDIAKSNEFIAIARKLRTQFYFCIFNLRDLLMTKDYQHNCKIHSLKFCPKTEYIYFGDDEGYLNIQRLDSEQIGQTIQISNFRINCIFLVSFAQLITVTGNYTIYLTDISENEKNNKLRVGNYEFRSHSNLVYSNLNLVYPNRTSICVQNIFDGFPFIQQDLCLEPKLPLQLEISKLGDYILTCQGQDIRIWAIKNEQKQLELKNIIVANNGIQNISFVLNDQYILYEDNYVIKIVLIKKNDVIKTINVNNKNTIQPYYIKQAANLDYICVVRKQAVCIFSNQRQIENI